MAKSIMNPRVDFFFTKGKKWYEEFEHLREIILDCGLTEQLKWGCPCYSLDNKNVVLIHGFKDYCAILFFKGALLKDPKNVMIQQTRNVQAARQMRFTSVKEINKLKATIKSYVKEAIELEKSGVKVKLKAPSEFPVTEEFKSKMKELPSLKKAFHALTPGRQRAYLLYFSQPKQSATRQGRVEKYVQHIFDGKGLND